MEPIFGNRVTDGVYIDRPGAYALILDDAGRMPVVQIEPGRFFLPGGGMEPGETVAECLVREVAEELGWSARTGPLLGRAIQYIESFRGGLIAVHAHYLRADLIAQLTSEPEHECLWLDPSAAIPLMTRQADRWAITRFLLAS